MDESNFATSLRSAITDRGLSLNRISRHLAARGTPVTVATLSYWQSGQRRPERGSSLRALEQLEGILQVPQGHLTERLGPPRERPRLPAEEEQRQAFVKLTDNVARALDALALPMNDGMSRTSVHSQMTVGANRYKVHERVRQVMVAEREGPDRWLVGVQDENPHAQAIPRTQATHNCRVGRVQNVPGDMSSLTELILDSPLRKGEAVLAEYLISYHATTGEDVLHARRHRHTLQEIVLQVHFDPHALPRRVVGFREPFDGPGSCQDLTIHHNMAEFACIDASPGMTGIRWEWD